MRYSILKISIVVVVSCYFIFCNSNSRSKVADGDKGFLAYFKYVTDYKELVHRGVPVMRYNGDLDQYDTLSKNILESTLMLKSLLSDSSLSRQIFQKQELGYIKLMK